jgi:hypothetical protein
LPNQDVVYYWIVNLLAEDGFALWFGHFDIDFIFLEWLCGDSNGAGGKAETDGFGGLHHLGFPFGLCLYFQCLEFEDLVFELLDGFFGGGLADQLPEDGDDFVVAA